MNKLIVAGICFFLSIPQVSEAQHTAFEPGKVWNDTEGNPINAHGGGILYKRYCLNGLRGSVIAPM